MLIGSRLALERVKKVSGSAIVAGALVCCPGRAAAEAETGYDKGFFIKTDSFELRVGTRTQLQFSSTDPDTFMYDSLLGREEQTRAGNELFLRRFKLTSNGHAWRPTVRYTVQLDVERFRPGGASDGNLRLDLAYVDLTARPWARLKLGQFKVPFGYEKMTSSGKLNLVDRSIVHSFFGVEQEVGVSLHGGVPDRKWAYEAAVTTGVSDNKGFNTRNDADASGATDFRYMARVTWEPLSDYAWEQGAVSHPAEPQLTLHLGLMTNQATIPLDNDPFLPRDGILPFKRDVLGARSPNFGARTDARLAAWSGVSSSRKPYDRTEGEFVAAFKMAGLYAEFQCLGGTVDPDLRYLRGLDDTLRSLDFDNRGVRVQAGVFAVPRRFELAGRWARVEREATARFSSGPTIRQEIDQTELRLGVNWYFSKHDWKWQSDLGQVRTEWRIDGRRLAVPERSQFAAGAGFDDRTILRNPRRVREFRTQFQLQF